MRELLLLLNTPNICVYNIEENIKWMEFYPDKEEEIPNDHPTSTGTIVMITVYVAANQSHDFVTIRFITDILVFLTIIQLDEYLSARRL